MMRFFAGWLFLVCVVGSAEAQVQSGKASYYSNSLEGRPTASGEPYLRHQMTAAHKTLPLHTRVRVVNLDNGNEIVVRINDRGPFIEGRIIDLSHSAANELGFIRQGIAKVRIEVIPDADLDSVKGLRISGESILSARPRIFVQRGKAEMPASKNPKKRKARF